MTATATPDFAAILKEFSGTLSAVQKSQEQYKSVIEGLLEVAKEPASKAGVSAEAWLATTLKDSHGPAIIGKDGAATRGSYSAKGIGMASFLQDCYNLEARGIGGNTEVAAQTLEKHYKGLHTYYGLPATATKTALAESSGVNGGYLVPPQFFDELLRFAMENQIVRPLAKKIPMTSRTVMIPTLDVSTTYATGVTPFLGGMIANWAGEAAPRIETEPLFRQTELNANELTFYCVASNTFIQDSMIAIDALLSQLFPEALAWYSDYAFLQGTGAGQPLGMLNAPGTIAMTRNTPGKVSAIDIFNMYSHLVAASRKNAVWVMHQSVMPQIYNLLDAGNRPLFMPLNAGSGAITGNMAGTLMGLPIYWTEKISPLGTKGDVLLFDGGQYIIGDRQGLQVEVSPHVYFLKNQMVWRIVARMDGQPWIQKPITLQDGTWTVSSYVVLN